MMPPLDERALRAFGVAPGWWFGIRHRVRWSEVDGFGHANHAAYLEWFEEARNRYLETVGLPLHSVTTPGPVMARLEVQYMRSLSYADEILVTARTAALGRTSLSMQYGVWRNGLIAACTATCVLIVNASGERVPIPPAVRAAMVAHDGAREE